nr:uncharacterized mitochondrial protein AtMg00810-like [Tanacetum cinerariifolium]
NLKLLINFVEKFLGTVKFGNDQIAPILSYGDLVQGAVMIKRVYYIEGLNHNLFSICQFCDADLEVDFRKSMCYIHDLKGNDLLTVRIVRTDKGTKFLNKTLHAYFASEGILHQTSVARTPEQNGVVERWNRTLVEAARTMLSAAKVPLFFWAEAIATTCFTHNRSLVIPRHEKTPYHIINDRKLLVKFFYIFGSLCYIVRDGENLDKIKEKDRTVTTLNELDLLFSPVFDELLNGSSKVVSMSSVVTTADAPNQYQQQNTTPLNNQTTPDPTCQIPTQAPTVASNENIHQAEMIAENAQVENYKFINIFCTPVQDRGEMSSRHVDSSNMHRFFQHHPPEHRWTKDHPLEQTKYTVSRRLYMDSNKLQGRGTMNSLPSSVGTPMATKHLDADLSETPIDQTKYPSMVGALMYLTASRPDIMHATCYCARYQAKPTEKYLTTVKRIFRYLKDTIYMGLWYLKDTGFELTAFLDSDHEGCLDSRKSTSGGIQFLGGDKLVSWSSKTQDCTSMSSAEAEYVSLSAYCAQVLWMQSQLTDYGFPFDKIPMYCDSKVAIAISCNPVHHSRIKHIDV